MNPKYDVNVLCLVVLCIATIYGANTRWPLLENYRCNTTMLLDIHVYEIMKYDRTCSASGMFVSNNVMSFN